MKQLTNVSKIVIVAVIAAIIIILVIVYNGNGQNPAVGANTTGPTNAALTATSPTETQNPAPNPTSSESAGIVHPKTPVAPAVPTIRVVTPVSGDAWTIGTQNPISWSRAGDFSGSISLLAATNKQLVGVILPETGPEQTSYTWNTTGVFLSRTDPQEKDVIPGSYIIEIIFDGNNLVPIFSPVFTITN